MSVGDTIFLCVVCFFVGMMTSTKMMANIRAELNKGQKELKRITKIIDELNAADESEVT